jgi:hypothetical protein
MGTDRHPRIQLLTVRELLEGKKLELPLARIDVTYKAAPKAKRKSQQGSLEGV